MKLNQLLILGLGAMMIMACRREGCTDQTAINYDKKAKKDNGTCQYGNDPSNPGGGGGTGGGPGGETLPIRLTGTESSDLTIFDQSTNPNVADYYIDGSWTLNANIVIKPGVRIEMRPGANIIINSNGSLDATGTPSNKIEIFGKQAQKNYWDYILFSSSNNPNNKFIHCNVSDGGTGSWGSGMVSLYGNSQLTIQNSSLRNAQTYALSLESEAAKIPSFQNNSIDNCGEEPVRFANMYQVKDIDNSTSYGVNNGANNDKNRIRVGKSSFSFNSTLTLTKLGVPYYLAKNMSIVDGVTTVQPGVEIIIGPGIKIEVSSSGALNLNGTSADRIKIRGDQPAKGWWEYILVNTTHPQNIFSNVDISDGSNGTWGSGMVSVYNNAQLSMGNTHISNGSNVALDVKASATFNDNGGNSWSDCDGGGGLLP